LRAADFAAREDLSATTLRWWSSALARATRAEHGSSAIEPIELSVEQVTRQGWFEIAVGSVVLRFEVGVDVDYVAAVAGAIAGR
jgi:hypothetical protein